MPQNTICSVCIANFNGEKFLEPCINSVLDQDFDLPVEIIVHDDCSTDDSLGLLHDKFPQVKLIVSDSNVGFCISNNRMVEAAKGKYILLLNNDAVLHQGALKTLYEAAEKYGPGAYGLAQYDATTGNLIDIGSLLDPFYNPIPNTDPKRADVAMVIGACLFIDRELWDEIGGFPDWFGSLAEDMYICCRVRLKGYPVKAFSETGFDHWVGSSFGGGKVQKNQRLATSLRRRKHSELNKSYVMWMTCPPPLFQIILPLHLLTLLTEGLIISAIKGNFSLFREIYLHCLISLFRNRRLLRQKRREAQRDRKIGPGDFLKPFKLLPHKLRMLFKYGIPKIS